MKYGLFAINYGTCADPEQAVRVAQYAESAGFESVWTAEHLVLPTQIGRAEFEIANHVRLLDSQLRERPRRSEEVEFHERHRTTDQSRPGSPQPPTLRTVGVWH